MPGKRSPKTEHVYFHSSHRIGILKLYFQVKEKKYETVQTTSRMLESTLKIISQTSAVGMGMGSRGSSRDRLAAAASRSTSLKKRRSSQKSEKSDEDRHAEFLSKRQRDVEKGVVLRKNSASGSTKHVNFPQPKEEAASGGEEEKLLSIVDAAAKAAAVAENGNRSNGNGTAPSKDQENQEETGLISLNADEETRKAAEAHVNAAFPTSDTMGSLNMPNYQ